MNKKHLKPVATEIYSKRLVGLKGSQSHDRWGSFVRGLGQLIELYKYEPTPTKPISRRYPNVKSALRSDMVRIGNDLRIIIAREKAKNEVISK